MPNTPIHFARPGRAERRQEPHSAKPDSGALEALSAGRVQWAEAAIKFNAIYMQLSGNDSDGTAERMQTCIEVAMDCVDETVRECVSAADKD